MEFADVQDLPGNPVAEPVRSDRRHQLRPDRRAQRHDGRVKSPVKPQSTITVITANTGEDVEAGIASLVRPALWDRLSGGTVAWDAGSMSMQAWPAEDNYRMGDIPNDWRQRILFVNAVFARNPVAWALLALAGLFVLSGLTHVALNKRQGS